MVVLPTTASAEPAAMPHFRSAMERSLNPCGLPEKSAKQKSFPGAPPDILGSLSSFRKNSLHIALAPQDRQNLNWYSVRLINDKKRGSSEEIVGGVRLGQLAK